MAQQSFQDRPRWYERSQERQRRESNPQEFEGGYPRRGSYGEDDSYREDRWGSRGGSFSRGYSDETYDEGRPWQWDDRRASQRYQSQDRSQEYGGNRGRGSDTGGGYSPGGFAGGYSGYEGDFRQAGFDPGNHRPGYSGYSGYGREASGEGHSDRGFPHRSGSGYGSSYAATGTQSGRWSGGSAAHGPKGYIRSDERLKEDICERIMCDYRIDAREVSVDVHDGKVKLEGTVPQRGMKHALEDLVDDCPGVKDIDNQVRVTRAGFDGDSTTGSSHDATAGISGSSTSAAGASTGSRKKE